MHLKTRGIVGMGRKTLMMRDWSFSGIVASYIKPCKFNSIFSRPQRCRHQAFAAHISSFFSMD
jgi:hypothetical protein